jgi:hypothetical protein
VVRVTFRPSDPTTVRLDSGQLRVITFYASWSNLSRSMAPVLNGLELKYTGRIQFTFLDVEDRRNERFKRTLGYTFPPQIFVLNAQGEIARNWKGYVRVQDLEAEFAAQGVRP